MHCFDTKMNPRIAGLLATLRDMSRVSKPEDLAKALSTSLHRWVRNDALLAISQRNLPDGQYKITRRIRYTQDGPVSTSNNPWKEWETIPAHSGGFVGDILNSGEPEVIHNLDLRNDPILGDDFAEFGSCVAIPLFDNGNALNWNIGFRHDATGFTVEDLELTMMLGNLVGRTTLNLLSTQALEKLHGEVQSEIEKIAAIQCSLLPNEIPDIAGLKIATSYKPCALACGDYYEFTPLDRLADGKANPNGRWGFVIADVSGHGASAAVIMAMMQAIVHAYPDLEEVHAHELLIHLNNQLVQKRLDHQFVTAFCAAYCPTERCLTYACAGHYPPRIKKPGVGNLVAPLPVKAGLPLGITDDFELEQQTVQLEPGDTLVLYTDGIIESFNSQREMFGIEQLDDAMECCSGDPDCIVQSINQALLKHEGGERPTDDQTIVAIRVES